MTEAIRAMPLNADVAARSRPDGGRVAVVLRVPPSAEREIRVHAFRDVEDKCVGIQTMGTTLPQMPLC